MLLLKPKTTSIIPYIDNLHNKILVGNKDLLTMLGRIIKPPLTQLLPKNSLVVSKTEADKALQTTLDLNTKLKLNYLKLVKNTDLDQTKS